MRNLEESINYYETEAEKLLMKSECYDVKGHDFKIECWQVKEKRACIEKAEEYKQLVVWLTELNTYRQMDDNQLNADNRRINHGN